MRLLDGDIDANIPSIVSLDACVYSINKVLACWSSPRSLKLTAMNTGQFSERSQMALTSASTMIICASSSWFQGQKIIHS